MILYIQDVFTIVNGLKNTGILLLESNSKQEQ